MTTEENNIENNKSYWFIDLDWYQSNNRSFFALAKDCLCPKCRKRFKSVESEVEPNEILDNIRDCCSGTPGFITSELPILASVFRLFLANGNQPVDPEDIRRQLNELRGGDSYRTSFDVLSRLLEADRYYGLKRIKP